MGPISHHYIFKKEYQPQFLWVHVNLDHVDIEGHVFLVCPIPLPLILFRLSLLQGFLSSEGRDWWRHLFRAECSKISHSLLNIWLKGCVFISICYRRKLGDPSFLDQESFFYCNACWPGKHVIDWTITSPKFTFSWDVFSANLCNFGKSFLSQKFKYSIEI